MQLARQRGAAEGGILGDEAADDVVLRAPVLQLGEQLDRTSRPPPSASGPPACSTGSATRWLRRASSSPTR
jgi:hypothetical protein